MAILTLVASQEILEYCEKVKAVILSKEQFYLDLLKPEYNILKVAGSSLGYKHTVETILKMIGSYISKNLGIPKSVLCMNIKQNCVHP
jgi:group I intron endonuclease